MPRPEGGITAVHQNSRGVSTKNVKHKKGLILIFCQKHTFRFLKRFNPAQFDHQTFLLKGGVK